MNGRMIVMTIDAQRYALQLSAVDRIARSVEVTPLPGAPDVIDGVINVRGRVVPVANLRKRLGLPARAVRLTDHLVIARSRTRPVALIVDEVQGFIERGDEDIVSAEAIVPGLEHVAGIIKCDDGLVLIHDLDAFLSLEEERALDRALEQAGADHAAS